MLCAKINLNKVVVLPDLTSTSIKPNGMTTFMAALIIKRAAKRFLKRKRAANKQPSAMN